MAAIPALLASNGSPQTQSPGIAGLLDSPRRRGLKKGLFISLLSFLVVPLIIILSIWLRASPVFAIISTVVLVVGGLLRMIYAMMFESPEQGGISLEANLAAVPKRLVGSKSVKPVLPPGRSVSASEYVSPKPGSWLDTNDLPRGPGSVTESTTRLLERDPDDQ